MKFSDLIGQEQAVHEIQRVRRTLPATLLFQGPDGVGKKTAAVIVAQTLLCERQGEETCDACGSCARVSRGIHPNFHLVVPDGTSHKIDMVRGILKEVSLKPFEEGAVVVVFDEAERLTEAAANALLKTLEEPPSHALFILVTSRPGMLPATVLSRCRVLRFRPLTEETIISRLGGKDYGAKEAAFLARSTGGSLGKAYELGQALREEALELAGFFEKFPRLTLWEITLWAEKLSRDAATTENFLFLLRHHLKEKIIEDRVPVSVWRFLTAAERGIRGNSARNLTLEVLLQRLCR